jgi:methylglyoxal synthase
MATYRTIPSSKHIALVAHDQRKDELLEWALKNREALSMHKLYATGTTGKIIESNLGQPVHKLLSGPIGGDQQLGAMIAEKKIDVMIFFWDPLSAQPHDPDIKALLRLCVVWNIPLACDSATADFLFTSPFMSREYESLQSDFSEYLSRKI